MLPPKITDIKEEQILLDVLGKMAHPEVLHFEIKNGFIYTHTTVDWDNVDNDLWLIQYDTIQEIYEIFNSHKDYRDLYSLKKFNSFIAGKEYFKFGGTFTILLNISNAKYGVHTYKNFIFRIHEYSEVLIRLNDDYFTVPSCDYNVGTPELVKLAEYIYEIVPLKEHHKLTQNYILVLFGNQEFRYIVDHFDIDNSFVENGTYNIVNVTTGSMVKSWELKKINDSDLYYDEKWDTYHKLVNQKLTLIDIKLAKNTKPVLLE